MALQYNPDRKEEQAEQFREMIHPRLRAILLALEWYAHNKMGRQHLAIIVLQERSATLENIYNPKDAERLKDHSILVGAFGEVDFVREVDGDKYLYVEVPPYTTEMGRFLFEDQQEQEART